MDAWITPALANGVGVVGVVFIVGVLIWRGYLVPRPAHLEIVGLHETRATEANERADRWENVALTSLRATEALAQPVTTAAKVLTTIPSPARDGAET